MMRDYVVTTRDGEKFRMSMDTEQSAAPVHFCAGMYDLEPGDIGAEWEPTPFQTADAGHDVLTMARLVARRYNYRAVRRIA